MRSWRAMERMPGSSRKSPPPAGRSPAWFPKQGLRQNALFGKHSARLGKRRRRVRPYLIAAQLLMSQDRKSIIPRAFDPSFLIAGICTGAFYYTVHQPSMRETILHRYTTEHIVE